MYITTQQNVYKIIWKLFTHLLIMYIYAINEEHNNDSAKTLTASGKYERP